MSRPAKRDKQPESDAPTVTYDHRRHRAHVLDTVKMSCVVSDIGGGQRLEGLEIRAALDRHWAASDANDFETEHDIYLEDAVLDYPQSGERIRGRHNIQITRANQPSKKRFAVAVLHHQDHGVQRRQGCTRNTILRGSVRGERVARSMGRTNGHLATRPNSKWPGAIAMQQIACRWCEHSSPHGSTWAILMVVRASIPPRG